MLGGVLSTEVQDHLPNREVNKYFFSKGKCYNLKDATQYTIVNELKKNK